MAVLNKIRERSVFLIIIIALALFSFVLADVIRNGGFSSQKSQNIIAKINDREVAREDFARKVESYQQNSRGNMTTAQAVNQAWDATVRDELLKEQFEKLGIEVGKDQINTVLRQQFSGNPNFTNEAGMFDINKMHEYIANLKATSPQAYQQWVSIEENVEKQAKSNIYYSLVKAGVGATLTEAEEAYKLENDNVDLQFVYLPYSSAENVEISKDEISAYIENHPKKYEVEALSDIQYVFFEEKSSSEDENAIKEEIQKLMSSRVSYNKVTQANDTIEGFKKAKDYEVFLGENSDLPFEDRYFFKDALPEKFADALFELEKGEAYGPYQEESFWKVSKMVESRQIPDSVKAKHMLISYEGLPTGEGLTRTKEEAEQLADSLLNVVKNDTEKFAELAKEYSADTSTNEEGGDLGWVNYRNVNSSSPFINHIFETQSGKPAIVETDYGLHIVEVEERKNEQKALKLATLAKQIVPSEKTMNDLFAEATKFEIAASQGSFADIAKENSYEIRPVKGIKALQENIPGVGNQRRIVQWAFNEETNVGDVSRFDISQGYVIAQVTTKNEKGLMRAEEASATVTPILRKQKQAQRIREKISGTSLEEIAQNQNVDIENANAVNLNNPRLPGAGSEPEVVGTAFSMKTGTVSEPIDGEKGVYVLKLLKRNEAAPLNSYRAIAEKETQSRTQQATQRLVKALENSAEIEDNRAKFY